MDIFKNRFGVWLMWLIPIACTGWINVVIWTVIQIMMCSDQKEARRQCKIPLIERPEIIELNKPKNLTERDKEMLRQSENWVKMPEGGYIYAKKRV